MHRASTLIASIVVMFSTTAPLLSSPVRLSRRKPRPKATPQQRNLCHQGGRAGEAKDQNVNRRRAGRHASPDLVDGKELKYTATAGLMPIKDAKGETEARIFFIAYTLDEPASGASRPLMFSFNGGPGSASVWLHLGTLGPRRVTITEEPVIPPPPFRLVDNEATWLDRTDLVFIDPVGTGYSRAAKPELNAKFHALARRHHIGRRVHSHVLDSIRPLGLAAVPDRRELRHDPRRRPGRLSGRPGHRVQRRDSGLVRLDFQGFVFSEGNDLPFLNYLPSYAASAWYHKKLPADLQQLALPVVLKEVEQWTDREYASILARGDQLTDAGAHRCRRAAGAIHRA